MNKFCYILAVAIGLTACNSNASTSSSNSSESSNCSDSINSTSYSHIDMTTMSNVFNKLEESPNGLMRNSILDTVPGLAHYELKGKGYWNPDSIKFDIFAEIYIDTIYPSKQIQSYLFERIDKELFNGFWCDMQDGDSTYWANAKPYMRQDANGFVEAWRPVFEQITHKKDKDNRIEYHEISNSLSFVACHKVYEDARYVTYLLEWGNTSHGGCGCRNCADYLTFDKSSGEVLLTVDLINDTNAAKITDALNAAYQQEYRDRMSEYSTMSIEVDQASGIAVLNEGILLYFYPYSIGCGAEGQYNIVISKALFE